MGLFCRFIAGAGELLAALAAGAFLFAAASTAF